MAIKGILFDLYGTLIDIETDESMEEIYRSIAHFLTYHGVYLQMMAVGLDAYFDPIIISGNYGFRKPDPRLIQKAIDVQTIFFASNQGRQSYKEVTANYVVARFQDVLMGVEALS